MRVHLSTVSDVVAAIPALLGFNPSESVLYVPLNQASGRLRGTILRTDIPSEHDVTDYLESVLAIAQRQHREGVGLVVVGAGEHDKTLPHRQLVARLHETFNQHKIPMLLRVWVSAVTRGARWHCYEHATCGDTIPDPRSTPLITELAALGHVTYHSRKEIEQQLAPASATTLQRRRIRLQARLPVSEDNAARQARVAVVRRAMAVCLDGILPEADEEIIALAEALTDPVVRDVALVQSESRHESLWSHLVREFPDPTAAEPTVILAVSAHARGDGATASVALARALQSAPEHPMASLLRRALALGISPLELRKMLTDLADGIRFWLR